MIREGYQTVHTHWLLLGWLLSLLTLLVIDIACAARQTDGVAIKGIYRTVIEGTWAEGTSVPISVPVAVVLPVVLVIATVTVAIALAVFVAHKLLDPEPIVVVVISDSNTCSHESEEQDSASDSDASDYPAMFTPHHEALPEA